MTDWGSVAIGTRIGQRPDAVFFDSWSQLIASGLRTGDAILQPAISLPHAAAANCLTEQFLGSPCDSILFVDDDIVFPADSLEKLRTADTNCRILAGVIPCRRGAMLPIVLRRLESDASGMTFAPIRDYGDGKSVLSADVVGLGFTLIHRHVIEDILTIKDRNAAFVWDMALGEDGEFCKMAQSFGHSVGADPRVLLGHRMMATARYDVGRCKTDITADGR